MLRRNPKSQIQKNAKNEIASTAKYSNVNRARIVRFSRSLGLLPNSRYRDVSE